MFCSDLLRRVDQGRYIALGNDAVGFHIIARFRDRIPNEFPHRPELISLLRSSCDKRLSSTRATDHFFESDQFLFQERTASTVEFDEKGSGFFRKWIRKF